MKIKLWEVAFLEFLATYAAVLAWAATPEEHRDFLDAWGFMNIAFAIIGVLLQLTFHWGNNDNEN